MRKQEMYVRTLSFCDATNLMKVSGHYIEVNGLHFGIWKLRSKWMITELRTGNNFAPPYCDTLKQAKQALIEGGGANKESIANNMYVKFSQYKPLSAAERTHYRDLSNERFSKKQKWIRAIRKAYKESNSPLYEKIYG